MKTETPSVSTQIADRRNQEAKMRRYFEDHPETWWTQDTLAEACGSDAGAVRTRISELKRDGMNLVGKFVDFRDDHGVWHRGKKVWMYQPRPSEPLGRDAGSAVDINAPKPLFPDAHVSGWQS